MPSGPLSGYDAAYPPQYPPATDVVCIYAGGDALHVWTPAEIARQNARYRLPIWVCSDPARSNGNGDASLLTAWLHAQGAPGEICVVLDLETAIDAPYVNAFGWTMRAQGYKVLPYGSPSTIFANPALDGYFVALPGASQIPNNCVGVQYGQGGGGAWDLDLFSPDLALWDTQPPSEEYIHMGDSVIAADGAIISHAVGAPGTPIAGHYLEFTRKSGMQGTAPNNGSLSIIDITADFPQFLVAP